MRLTPATVVVRTDQDHGDVELALLDVRNLEATPSVADAAGALVAGAPLDVAAAVCSVVGVEPPPHAATSKTVLMATPNSET